MKSINEALGWGNSIPFSWNMVWCAYVLNKASLFTWEVTWIKVLTLDQLEGGIGCLQIDVFFFSGGGIS